MLILTHGAEIWPWTKEGISRLTAEQMRFLRSIDRETKQNNKQ